MTLDHPATGPGEPPKARPAAAAPKTVPSVLDYALAHAAKGFRVFPLEANGKRPAIDDWLNRATTDAAQIRKWFGGTTPRNIGIATGDGLLVVDIDVKNGKDGIAEFAALVEANGDGEAPPGYVVATPTGGCHVYFRTPVDKANSAGKLAPGIDTRGHHGYVVAAGSTIDGKSYTTRAGGNPADASQWLLNALDTPAPERGEARKPVTALDTPLALKLAVDWLATEAPLAIEGAHGDHTTYAVAARLKDFGISRGKALELMLEHWNERCSPPWHPDDLQRKIANAYRYGQEPPGSKSPEADFGPAGAQAPGGAGGLPPVYTLYRDIRFTAPEDLIKGVLPRRGVAVVYGDPGTGKSALVQNWASCVATGRDWGDRRVEQGSVLCIAAEAPASYERRFVAARMESGVADIPVMLRQGAVNLMKEAQVDTLIADLPAIRDALGSMPKLVIIDTLAVSMAGGDENATGDMNTVTGAAMRIAAATDGLALLVHHTGKDGSKGQRGSSALLANIDASLYVEKTGDRHKLVVKKQRDGEGGTGHDFRLYGVTVEKDKYGDDVTAVLAEPVGRAARAFARRPVTGDAKTALDVLRDMLEAATPEHGADGLPETRVAIDAWRARLKGDPRYDRTVGKGKGAAESVGNGKTDAFAAFRKRFSDNRRTLRDTNNTHESGGFAWV